MIIKEINNPTNTVSSFFIFDGLGSSTSTINISPSKFKVYPNPSQGVFNIKNKNHDIDSIEVYSVSGQYLMDIKMNMQQQINLTTLVQGSYLIKFLDKSGHQIETKIITKL